MPSTGIFAVPAAFFCFTSSVELLVSGQSGAEVVVPLGVGAIELAVTINVLWPQPIAVNIRNTERNPCVALVTRQPKAFTIFVLLFEFETGEASQFSSRDNFMD